MLKGGVDANAINAQGRTSIITAAWRGHIRIVRTLLNAGVEIDATDNEGRTALCWAAINGDPDIVDLLLDEVALIDVRDNKGLTPLMRAAWNGHEDIVEALLESGADKHAADDRGVTAMQRAEAVNERGIVHLLLQDLARGARETPVPPADGGHNIGAQASLDQRPGGAAPGNADSTSAAGTSSLVAQLITILTQGWLIILVVIAIGALLLFLGFRRRS